mgnify:CR=1 FL=1
MNKKLLKYLGIGMIIGVVIIVGMFIIFDLTVGTEIIIKG